MEIFDTNEIMERHDYIVNTLVRTGFRSSLKGFNQFCKCIELYVDNIASTAGSIYGHIANEYNCSKESVEKNLRRLFVTCDVSKIVSDMFGIEFNETGNKEIIAKFAHYFELQRKHYRG